MHVAKVLEEILLENVIFWLKLFAFQLSDLIGKQKFLAKSHTNIIIFCFKHFIQNKFCWKLNQKRCQIVFYVLSPKSWKE